MRNGLERVSPFGVAALATIIAASSLAAAAAETRRNVVVYGATSGGITAAIQAKAMGEERDRGRAGGTGWAWAAIPARAQFRCPRPA
jgi:hypothetical protein